MELTPSQVGLVLQKVKRKGPIVNEYINSRMLLINGLMNLGEGCVIDCVFQFLWLRSTRGQFVASLDLKDPATNLFKS